MNNAQIIIREKKLGLLIRDARMAERRSIKECADAIGVKPGLFRAYEEGRRSPSLPELETLVYYLKLPITHFWGRETMSESSSPVDPLDTAQLIALRCASASGTQQDQYVHPPACGRYRYQVIAPQYV